MIRTPDAEAPFDECDGDLHFTVCVDRACPRPHPWLQDGLRLHQVGRCQQSIDRDRAAHRIGSANYGRPGEFIA